MKARGDGAHQRACNLTISGHGRDSNHQPTPALYKFCQIPHKMIDPKLPPHIQPTFDAPRMENLVALFATLVRLCWG